MSDLLMSDAAFQSHADRLYGFFPEVNPREENVFTPLGFNTRYGYVEYPFADAPPSPPAPPENTRDRGHVGVCLHSVKDSGNVGGAMRAAHVFGADYVMTVNSRTGKHRTDTSKAYKHVPVFEYELEENSDLPAPKDTKIIVVELCAEAVPLASFEHPERALYVFGPEDGNVPQHIVDSADAVVYIPSNLCLNLAAAVNVVLYDRQSKENN